MRKTCYLTLIVFFATISNTLFAQKVTQTNEQRIRFGIEAGVTAAGVRAKDRDADANATTTVSMKTLCFVSAKSDIPFNNLLSLQPGLSLAGKGFKRNRITALVGWRDNETHDYNLWYLEVPIKLVAKVPVGPGRAIFGAGPYISLGLFGKFKDKDIISPGGTFTEEDNIKFSSTLDPNAEGDVNLYTLKPLDAGADLSLGYSYKDVYVNLSGSFGFVDIANKAAYQSLKNLTYSISLGYFF